MCALQIRKRRQHLSDNIVKKRKSRLLRVGASSGPVDHPCIEFTLTTSGTIPVKAFLHGTFGL